MKQKLTKEEVISWQVWYMKYNVVHGGFYLESNVLVSWCCEYVKDFKLLNVYHMKVADRSKCKWKVPSPGCSSLM